MTIVQVNFNRDFTRRNPLLEPVFEPVAILLSFAREAKMILKEQHS